MIPTSVSTPIPEYYEIQRLTPEAPPPSPARIFYRMDDGSFVDSFEGFYVLSFQGTAQLTENVNLRDNETGVMPIPSPMPTIGNKVSTPKNPNPDKKISFGKCLLGFFSQIKNRFLNLF